VGLDGHQGYRGRLPYDGNDSIAFLVVVHQQDKPSSRRLKDVEYREQDQGIQTPVVVEDDTL
jgi:hypothetical protein